MSHASLLPVRAQDYAPPAQIGRWRSYSFTVGVLFSVLAIIGWILRPALFYRSWLVAFLFWLGLTTGSLTLLMLQYTSGGNWGRIGRRFWEAAAGNLPWMLLFFVPIVLGMKQLFPWTHPDVAATLGVLIGNSAAAPPV